MSYRHSSYRKMSKAVAKARTPDGRYVASELTRSERDRVLHWSNLSALPKPAGWGKPKGWRL